MDLSDLTPGVHEVKLSYKQAITAVEYKLDPSTVTVVVSTKQSATKDISYEVLNLGSLDSKMSVKDIELDTTNVIAKGTEEKLNKIATIKALVNISNLGDPVVGENSIKDNQVVAYDENGKILDVEVVPKTVTAKITITSPSKEVPIKVVPTGNLAFGKSIKAIESSVSSVTIYGDQEAVDKIEVLEVEIDVKGLEKNKDYHVTLKKPSGITELSSKTVTVKVYVDNSITKEFENIAISTENLNSKYNVQALTEDDRQVTVVVSGSKENVDALDPSSIKAYVDLEKLGVGTHDVEVKVTGDDLKLTYASKTKKVKIKITEKK